MAQSFHDGNFDGEKQLLGSLQSVLSREIKPIIYETFDDTSASNLTSQFGGNEVGAPSGCSVLWERLYPSGFCSEAKKMFKISWQMILTHVCQIVIGPISLMFCGHLGDVIKFDGAALGNSMINVIVLAVGQGLGTACDTCFSQTFGSRNKKHVGVYVQKAILVFPFFLVGCCVVMLNMTGILIVLGQNPQVAQLAGEYLIIFISGAFSFFMYIILAKYIQNQNIVIPNVVIGLLANAVNILLHYIFLFQLNWETNGSAIAQTMAYCLMFVLTLVYILVSKCYKETWDGWSAQCLQDWGHFIGLCTAGMMMLCMEWLAFEIGVFLSGELGTTEMGVQSILLQFNLVWFPVPLGVQISCAIRVGQYLGAGKGDQAKTVGNLAITIAGFVSVMAMIIFSTLQYQLPYVFTDVDAMAQLTGDILPIVAIYVFFDAIAIVCKGVLFGTGRQNFGTVVVFLSYYIVALPIGIPLMFLTQLKNAGFWWALAISLSIQAMVLLVVMFRTDWDDQVVKAQERAGMLRESEEGVRASEDPECRKSTLKEISTSLTKADMEAHLKNYDKLPLLKRIYRHILAALMMCLILGTAIVLKVIIMIPELSGDTKEDVANYTVYSNITTHTSIVETVKIFFGKLR